MKNEEIDQLIEELDVRRRLGWHFIKTSGGINDFLGNYRHGPTRNILGHHTFRRAWGVRTIDGKTRVYAIFEKAIIAGFKSHIGTLFVAESKDRNFTLAIEI